MLIELSGRGLESRALVQMRFLGSISVPTDRKNLALRAIVAKPNKPQLLQGVKGIARCASGEYRQQYLALPNSRPYCSAQPSGVPLGEFNGSDYKLPASVWSNYDWNISHCVLRGDNAPIAV